MNSEPPQSEKNGKAECGKPLVTLQNRATGRTTEFLEQRPPAANDRINLRDDEEGTGENDDNDNVGDEDHNETDGFENSELQDDEGWVPKGVPGVVIYPKATTRTRGSNRALVLALLVYWLANRGLRGPRARARIDHELGWVGTCGAIGRQIGLSKQKVWTALQWIKQNIEGPTILPYKKTQLQIKGDHGALAKLISKPCVFVPAGIVQLCGDANQAILLADICYWFNYAENRIGTKSIDGKPFIRKTHRRMRDETGLSRHQIKRALLALVKRGYVRRKRRVDNCMRKKLYLAPCVELITEEWENAKIEGSYREYLDGMSG